MCVARPARRLASEALPAMNLSAPFIQRPVATLLLSLALLLVGALSYRLLPVAPLPDMDFPTITVQASLLFRFRARPDVVVASSTPLTTSEVVGALQT